MNNRRGGYQPPLHFKSVSKADTLTRRKAYFTYHEVVNFTYRRWISPAVRQISLQKQGGTLYRPVFIPAFLSAPQVSAFHDVKPAPESCSAVFPFHSG